ncbi:MAG: PIN domain-containing protein [Pseudomonadales bacterium]|jgi:hypothetical protein|nr:PIN domain-containing protein [Pseudomonadales bacterium]MDP7358920.1 PIN domain-containing protein [Pseudomonadales bacterium]MDP7596503.1 PIN domain-containing protein [Pseudomonadales bacterium]HJN49599.1 TA system VapC family ribonuclease toxin [Pseudomonadales bacterium]|tara:strand:- start:481 stop:912 length:432 start_codon:yes stop_codon:yes gene_type:complete
MIAVDTNILIYAHRAETDLHKTSLEWLTELAEGREPWAIPVFCITEFLRVVTHARVFNPPSKTPLATRFIEELLESPTCRIASPGSSFFEHLKALLNESGARGNLVFDAQIVALCREQGISEILTNDRDFERFGSLNVLLLDD